MRPGFIIYLLVLVLLPLPIFTESISASSLDRDSDPIIMTGSTLTSLLGKAQDRIVAFRYESGWVQIAVQVDERVVIDYGNVYNSTPVGFAQLVYADAGTFTGADSDPMFDSNDELIFMAKDAGDRVLGQPDPAGVVPNSRIELTITDPISLQETWIYLFESAGGLLPDAGTNYVTYTFNLLSGPYLTTYNTTTGPNPENSEVVTAHYRMHFSDRWIRDEVNIYAGGATGADILDRHKNLFAPGNCARSEDTFSAGEGAFFINKDGPVRAVRSYVGANSGPLTQRDHFFYERRHDVRTTLRVHAIQGVMDFYDYGAAANGMRYYNDANLSGVDIDGVPETITPSAIQWEMVTGLQGTLIFAEVVSTDIPAFTYSSYWLDDSSPLVTQCTGDPDAYGSSGVWITDPIPNTDPVFVPPPYYNMVFDRTSYVESPNQTVSLAQMRFSQAMQPVTAKVTLPTAVAGETPVLLHLAQNAPNPFTHSTMIGYNLSQGQRGVIRVYDPAGHLVKNLRDNVTGAGAVSWSGHDAMGKRVASGVYFYRLETQDGTITRKMVVLR